MTSRRSGSWLTAVAVLGHGLLLVVRTFGCGSPVRMAHPTGADATGIDGYLLASSTTR
jgi:hypothetical protein